MIGREEKNGPQGDGINIDKSFTLNTTDRHAVAIRTAQTGANGIGVADEKAHTLDGANGQAVVYENHAQDSRVTESVGGCSEPISFHPTQDPISSRGKTHCMGTGTKNGSASIAVVYENHAQDSRVTESVGVCPTLHSQMGTGGGNVPFVLTPLLK